MFQQTNSSYPLIRTRTCASQGVINVSFSETIAYILNDPHPCNKNLPAFFSTIYIASEKRSKENFNLMFL